MLMLDRAQSISRQALAGIPTPEPTRSWRPVAHSEVVDTLLDRAGTRGLKVCEERYAILPGTVTTPSGVQTNLPGARLFGTLDFEPIEGIRFPEGCRPSAGIRNSHDKTFALSILSGARVLVCANGVLSAEHVVTRKHTSRLNLVAEIDRALDAFLESMGQFQNRYERWVSCRLTFTQAHSLIVQAARGGAFSSAQILPVLEEFEKPQHEAFRTPNAWHLYQAATERMKRQSPGRQVEGFKALNAVWTEQFS